jgi:hypothetical protein
LVLKKREKKEKERKKGKKKEGKKRKKEVFTRIHSRARHIRRSSIRSIRCFYLNASGIQIMIKSALNWRKLEKEGKKERKKIFLVAKAARSNRTEF